MALNDPKPVARALFRSALALAAINSDNETNPKGALAAALPIISMHPRHLLANPNDDDAIGGTALRRTEL